MQFVANCVRPARVFVLHLRAKLAAMKQATGVVDEEMRKDIWWWIRFMPTYNGVSIMWMKQALKEDILIALDSCLTGMGAHHQKQFIHSQFPSKYLDRKIFQIHHLEMVALMVALKVWKKSLSGFRFIMWCDNQAVVEVINAGRTRDPVLQELLREVVFIAVENQFEIVMRYLSSQQNRIADVLSRLHLGTKYRKQLKSVIPEGWEQCMIPQHYFNMESFWCFQPDGMQ